MIQQMNTFEAIDQRIEAFVRSIGKTLTVEINRSVGKIKQETVEKRIVPSEDRFDDQMLRKDLLMQAEKNIQNLRVFFKSVLTCSMGQKIINKARRKEERYNELCSAIESRIVRIGMKLNQKALRKEEIKYEEKLLKDQCDRCSLVPCRISKQELAREERMLGLTKVIHLSNQAFEQEQLKMIMGSNLRLSLSKGKNNPKKKRSQKNPEEFE